MIYLTHIKNRLWILKNLLKSNEAIFKDVYLSGKWKSNESINSKFDSGSGSDENFCKKYVDTIGEYAERKNIKQIIDVGCGDFRVGKAITKRLPDVAYAGLDVFDDIVAYNKSEYSSERVNFYKHDLTKSRFQSKYEACETLILIRQVLQHLSNKQINAMIKNISGFPYVIITEHQLHKIKKPNKKIVPGHHNRTEYGSSVVLDKSPFNLDTKLLVSVPVDVFSSLNSYEVKV